MLKPKSLFISKINNSHKINLVILLIFIYLYLLLTRLGYFFAKAKCNLGIKKSPMKNKKLSTLFLSLAVILMASNAFSQALFQNTYSASTNLKPMFSGPASGGGIIMCGATDATPSDGFISKTDLNGVVQWTKKIGGSQEDVISAVKRTSDGGYIAVGYTNSAGAGDKDALLIKLDASGNITWSKTYGTTTIDYGKDVIQTSDGGYAVCGLARYESGLSDKGGIYVFKTNSSGTLLWSKMWGEDSWYNPHSIIEAKDGGLLISGGGVSGKLILVKVSSSGSFEWYRGIMPNNISTCEGSKIIITSDNNYMILTYGDKNSSTRRIVSLIKTDFSGVELWVKDYNFASYDGVFNGIVQIWDGGYLISGRDDMNFFTMRVDNAGVLATARISTTVTFGEDGGFNLTKLSDGSYASIGQKDNGILLVKCGWGGITGCANTNSSVNESTGSLFSNYYSNTWASVGTTTVNTASLTATSMNLTKTTLCSTSVGIETTTQNKDISVFPNPFTDKFEIDLAKEYKGVEISIYDVLSHIVYTNKYQSTNKITIDRNKMASGVYFYQILSDNMIVAKGRVVAE